MASYNPQEGSDDHLYAMRARLQAARNAQEKDHDLQSRFFNSGNSFQGFPGQSGNDSPLTGVGDFPPPAPTPPGNFGHSHHPSGMSSALAPIGTMPSGAMNNTDRSNNLLNLLKFSSGQQSAHSGSQQASPPVLAQASSSFDQSLNTSRTGNPLIHAPVPMPADPQGLLANLMRGNLQNEGSRSEHHPAATQSWNSGPPAMDTQSYLLNLLQRPKPAQNDQPANDVTQPTTLTPQSATGSAAEPLREYVPKPPRSENASHEATPLPSKFGAKNHVASPSARNDYGSPASHNAQRGSFMTTKFDYTNPFDEFSTAAPKKTSNTSTPAAVAPVDALPTELPAPAFTIIKKVPSIASSPGINTDNQQPGNERARITSPDHLQRSIDGSPALEFDERQKLSPAVTGTPDRLAEKNKETVSEAMIDLAEKANIEAQEALARAEEEEVHAKIANELESMRTAQTDAEFQEAAKAAAQDIGKELGRKEHAGALEKSFSPEVAEAIRDIVEDTAHGPIADSWESAEADEIVVIEESLSPIKVYSFPMKPWISLTLQETDEPRPQFRDEIILDIARLKKEFDQIDRNLVSATGNYVVYAMAKAGFRMISQDDGQDAKLYTDTKDRMFNVAVAVTPSDLNKLPVESIIATGISGTVYYVQMKNGERDVVEDSHPEQHGFILPPISTQEGDAPGGVLKTRAKVSSSHPDYFAVGRGKTISIIWPALIMQKKLFKTGHSRVVDTEKLLKECALRINTGKAGKDFTFSQDDTTIVSLDKSGRVKFWDVRDLTAADEISNSRYPLPAQTLLEVKEPLLTLNTTPEGEKAWPTSVLLLDKMRPYQKRCALRYMIVGMKQNHTLQLWDLALGKPVQEFNLPHSKESDAVCSVLYHPPTGIIVVGHPTRNSIYFLHLSAPKYSIKGLSQVVYIQRLVAKDSSIPEPDSTAVISGVREYSFSNKGQLRSLDIMDKPDSSGQDQSEDTLFELYAVHSKGVTCLSIKQHELGWSKDNKVINEVDAIEIGFIKSNKLKELPGAIVSEPPPAYEESVTAPIRIASRPVKEPPAAQTSSSLPSASGQDSGKRGAEVSNVQSQRKEIEIPAAPSTQLDKAEKKNRKKREKASAAAEKLASDNVQSNGTAQSSQSSRLDTVSGKNAETKTASQSPMTSESIQSAIKQISSGLGEKLTTMLSRELKENRGKVDTEFQTREDSFAKSQQDLLDIVSSILNENVQAVLTKTISQEFEETVVPALSSVVMKTVTDQIDNKMGGRISHSIQNQMQKLVPSAVIQALQKPDLAKAVSERVASSVVIDTEASLRQVLISSVTPIFSEMAAATAQSIVNDVQMRTAVQVEEFEQRRIADNNKIEHLTDLVTRLTDRVSLMASAQEQFQDSFLKLQQQMPRDGGAVLAQSQPAQSMPPASVQSQNFYPSPSAHSKNQLMPFPSFHSESSFTKNVELDTVTRSIQFLMNNSDYEIALVRWIQQENHMAEIFDNCLAKFDPGFMPQLPVLVLLSVGMGLAPILDGPYVAEKISWIEAILQSLHDGVRRTTVCDSFQCVHDNGKLTIDQDVEVLTVIPGIMETFRVNIQNLAGQILVAGREQGRENDATLQRLSAMAMMTTRIRDFVQGAY
ncbi:hypothetical protein F4778DRAFT_720762 [Xylariomycetidae sp. FL2044]|nr:hypothetical protein F4778DRAFT_720762 [Xylariomycetidae sp. FL2044]